MICWDNLYHFYCLKYSGAVKRVFATVNMIQFMPANHSNYTKMRFQNVFVTLLRIRRIVEHVTSPLIPWHKHHDLNAENTRRHSQ